MTLSPTPAAMEFAYLALVLALMLLPRLLQRFGLPAPLGAFLLGLAAAAAVREIGGDPTLALLSTLGISSLFLFAGLEIDVAAFRRARWALAAHLALRVLALAALAWLAMRFLGLPWQAAGLLGLALLTPSTGFILDTLPQQGLDEDERFWVAAKAVAGEVVALGALFVIVQSGSVTSLAVSSLALLAMLAGLPLLFVLLGRYVLPHAPGAEFSLLVVVGLLAASITKHLGVYYLVGAFLAGLVARLLRERMPQLASEANLDAVRLFASFFVPFYFFHAAALVPPDAFQLEALAIGLAVSAVLLPLRIGVQWLHRRIVHRESAASSLRVAIALAPTLVFTLVLAGILRERYGLSPTWYGALLVYAFVSTALPAALKRRGPVAVQAEQPGTAQPG